MGPGEESKMAKKKKLASRRPAPKVAPKARAAAKSKAKKPAAWPTTIIDPGWSWDDKLPYAQGKKVGPFIYTAGQSAIESDGTIVGKGDIKAQTHKTFENIRAILRKAGADLQDIVKITTYITNEQDCFKMLEARGEVFGKNLPASTAVVVKALAYPEMMIEIEAVAIKM